MQSEQLELILPEFTASILISRIRPLGVGGLENSEHRLRPPTVKGLLVRACC